MSPRAASTDLAATLHARLRGRVLLLGVGNPLRGDDAVGSWIAQRLLYLSQATPLPERNPQLVVIDAEDVPESFLGPAIAARPDVVLLVDAAELGLSPGGVTLVDTPALGRGALFTHRTPLGPVADYLQHATGADVLLLAIQPGALLWGEELSHEVRAAAASLVAILTAVLGAAGEAPCHETEILAC